eukprot:g87.t1
MLRANPTHSLPNQRKNRPWVERYRPRSLAEVQDQEECVASLRECVKQQTLPHLLFYGPPGTGKTSTILAAAHDMFGPTLIRDRVLELNASDERGIGVIRNRVKNFAQSAVSSKGPKFKLIILDEADSMTQSAQAALRRTMELYSNVTRFCLICNYVSRIIDPLTSRCAKFRFHPLRPTQLFSRLQHISTKENFNLPKETLDALLKVSGGDLRKAITFMQTGTQVYKSELTPQQVEEIAGTLPQDTTKALWATLLSTNIDGAIKEVNKILDQGHNTLTLLNLIGQQALEETFGPIGEITKAQISIAISEADVALADGASEKLQLLRIATFIIQCLKNTK